MTDEQSGELHDVGTQKVFHLHFQKWPDKSVPTDPGPLLEYIQEVWKVSQTFVDPPSVVVHCRYLLCCHMFSPSVLGLF